jgi:hypothetical protein
MSVHEDTLEAINYVCDQLEDHCTRDANRYVGDGASVCIECDMINEDETGHRTDLDCRHPHKPDCKLIVSINMLRAFVRVEETENDRSAN